VEIGRFQEAFTHCPCSLWAAAEEAEPMAVVAVVEEVFTKVG
jgi:hypothetical protein